MVESLPILFTEQESDQKAIKDLRAGIARTDLDVPVDMYTSSRMLAQEVDETFTDWKYLYPKHEDVSPIVVNAAAMNDHKEYVRQFLDRGYDPTEQDFQGWSIVHAVTYAGRNYLLKWLMKEYPVDIDLTDLKNRGAIHIAVETRRLQNDLDVGVQLVEADCSIEPNTLHRILIYSLKNDYSGFPKMMIKRDQEDENMPLLKSEATQSSFSLPTIIKYEAINVLSLLFDSYDTNYLNELANQEDVKGMTPVDYANESKNDELKTLFFQKV